MASKKKTKTKVKKAKAKKPSPSAKKIAASNSYGSSSEFIRNVDPSKPAAEVVKMAEAKGIKISASYVYNVRMKMKGGRGAKRGKTSKKSKAARASDKYAALEAKLAPLVEAFTASISQAAIEFVKESL